MVRVSLLALPLWGALSLAVAVKGPRVARDDLTIPTRVIRMRQDDGFDPGEAQDEAEAAASSSAALAAASSSAAADASEGQDEAEAAAESAASSSAAWAAASSAAATASEGQDQAEAAAESAAAASAAAASSSAAAQQAGEDSAAAQASAAAAGEVFPTPTPTPQQQAAASYDQRLCLWESGMLFVGFMAFIPATQSGYDFDTINNDFRGSLGNIWQCAAYTKYQSYSVGEYGTTFAVTFNVPDGCEDYMITNAIFATNGISPTTPCTPLDEALENDPDLSNLIAELPEAGDDGEE